MYNTYNMGVGMSIVVPKEQVDASLEILRQNGENAYVIGEIVEGDEGVVFC
jgi:phosphoribosylformylglycinamidine cyclo-ligase